MNGRAEGISVRSYGSLLNIWERGNVMRLIRLIGFFAMGIFLIIGCGKNPSSSSCIQEGATSGSLIVHVSCGNPEQMPLYTWEDPISNDSTAENITVARTSDLKTPVWEVQSSSPIQNNLNSPWQQGTGANQTVTTETNLTTNIPYRVTITKVDGSGTPTGSGYREFTIEP